MIDIYTSGKCYIFALALSSITKMEVKAIIFKSTEDMYSDEHVGHSWCINEDGVYFDARGNSVDLFFDSRMTNLTKDERIKKCNSLFLKDFHVTDYYYEITNYTDLEFFADCFLSEYTNSDLEVEINEAIDFIKSSNYVLNNLINKSNAIIKKKIENSSSNKKNSPKMS